MIRTDMRFDTRTLAHRMRRGEISRKELEEHLDELPDEADEATEAVTPFTASSAEKRSGSNTDQISAKHAG
jgi:hypothetical protein